MFGDWNLSIEIYLEIVFWNLEFMKKILFIEDEPALQNALSSTFEAEGYMLFSALDGEIGLQTVKREKPDLILLDLILPKISGFEILKKLKENPETKEIPVIVLTNLEGSRDIERALGLGATTYLVKTNYKLEEIVEKIKDLLQ